MHWLECVITSPRLVRCRYNCLIVVKYKKTPEKNWIKLEITQGLDMQIVNDAWPKVKSKIVNCNICDFKFCTNPDMYCA